MLINTQRFECSCRFFHHSCFNLFFLAVKRFLYFGFWYLCIHCSQSISLAKMCPLAWSFKSTFILFFHLFLKICFIYVLSAFMFSSVFFFFFFFSLLCAFHFRLYDCVDFTFCLLLSWDLPVLFQLLYFFSTFISWGVDFYFVILFQRGNSHSTFQICDEIFAYTTQLVHGFVVNKFSALWVLHHFRFKWQIKQINVLTAATAEICLLCLLIMKFIFWKKSKYI